MKAALEKIEPGVGSSFTVRKFGLAEPCGVVDWHFHPEFEIVFVSKGCAGKRHIGNHISYFDDGDLIFLGPNLPHFGFSNREKEGQFEIVVQMKEDFLGDNFLKKPELRAITQLFEKAKLGLSFHGKTKEDIGWRLNSMLEMNNFDRLIELLSILQQLAQSSDYQILNATGFALEVDTQDHDRINKIYSFVEEHFQEPISLQAIADEVNMTVPAFCRYFKKLTRLTFTRFVNEIRVTHARRLLAGAHKTIAEICFECGFNNFSHFNKTFKAITGESPSNYRKSSKELIF